MSITFVRNPNSVKHTSAQHRRTPVLIYKHADVHWIRSEWIRELWRQVGENRSPRLKRDF